MKGIFLPLLRLVACFVSCIWGCGEAGGGCIVHTPFCDKSLEAMWVSVPSTTCCELEKSTALFSHLTNGETEFKKSRKVWPKGWVSALNS